MVLTCLIRAGSDTCSAPSDSPGEALTVPSSHSEMAEDAAAKPPAKPPAKPAKKKPAQPRKPGPQLWKLVLNAVRATSGRRGTSVPAIKKCLKNDGVDVKKNNKVINRTIVRLTTKGQLVQVTGQGASGSFKLAKTEKPGKKPAAKKAQRKKPVAKKPLAKKAAGGRKAAGKGKPRKTVVKKSNKKKDSKKSGTPRRKPKAEAKNKPKTARPRKPKTTKATKPTLKKTKPTTKKSPTKRGKK